MKTGHNFNYFGVETKLYDASNNNYSVVGVALECMLLYPH